MICPRMRFIQEGTITNMRLINTLSVMLIAAITLSAQQGQTIDNINYLADITANTVRPETRKMGQEKLTVAVERYLEQKDFNITDLKSLQFVSVMIPDDGSFALITWPYKDGDGTHHYSGYFINSDKTYHKLTDTPIDQRDLIYETLDADNWYGALYYNMLPTELDGKTAYLLFGHDGHTGSNQRKLLEVLTVDDGQPTFGAPLFKMDNSGSRNSVQHRHLIEYNRKATATLNYNDGLGLIMQDHLISRMGIEKGQGPTNIPDGSYIGFKWDGKHWAYVDKLYDQVSETPPNAGKKRSSSKRDIIGRAKKN